MSEWGFGAELQGTPLLPRLQLFIFSYSHRSINKDQFQRKKNDTLDPELYVSVFALLFLFVILWSFYWKLFDGMEFRVSPRLFFPNKQEVWLFLTLHVCLSSVSSSSLCPDLWNVLTAVVKCTRSASCITKPYGRRGEPTLTHTFVVFWLHV